MLAELSEDKYLKDSVEWAIQDYVAFEKILEEVQEYIAELETEEKQEELKENLDSI